MKYSSSFAFFRSSHLFAIFKLLKTAGKRVADFQPLRTLGQLLFQPFTCLGYRLRGCLLIGRVLGLRIVEESVPRPLVHFDLEFLLILLEGFTKHIDFGLSGAGIIGAVVTQKRRGYAL